MNKNKSIHNNKHETGQIVVLMAFAVIGLLAMLGLAIDGGRLFFTRRDQQNAVDAAVLAATYELCTINDDATASYATVIEQARKQVVANGFVEGDDVDVYVGLPTRPMSANLDLRYFIEVSIKTRLEPYFIQFVYDGLLEVTTYGIGYCRPEFDPAKVPAMFASAVGCGCDTGSAANSGIKITLSEGDMYSLAGGLMASNSDIYFNGSAGHESTLQGDIDTPCGTTVSKGTTVDSNGDPLPPNDDSDYFPTNPIPYDISYFVQDGYFHNLAKDEYGGSALFTKISGDWSPNGPIEGLYYVEGDVDLKFAEGEDANGDGQWDGTTIAATGQIGSVGGLQLDKYYIGGVAMFTSFAAGDICSTGNSNVGIGLSGNGNQVQGFLIAPSSSIRVSFSDADIVGGMMATVIDFSGSKLDYVYDPSILEPLPPQVQMAQ